MTIFTFGWLYLVWQMIQVYDHGVRYSRLGESEASWNSLTHNHVLHAHLYSSLRIKVPSDYQRRNHSTSKTSLLFAPSILVCLEGMSCHLPAPPVPHTVCAWRPEAQSCCSSADPGSQEESIFSLLWGAEVRSPWQSNAPTLQRSQPQIFKSSYIGSCGNGADF